MQKLSVSQQVEQAETALAFIEQDGSKLFKNSSTQYLCHPLKRDRFSGWRFVNIEDDFRLELAKHFQKLIVDCSNKSVASLDFDCVTEDTMGIIPSSDFFQFSDGMDALPAPTADGATFAGDTEFLRKARYFAIELEIGDVEKVTCYQKVGSDFYTEKGRFSWFTGDRYSFKKLADELVVFPSTMSFFEFRDYIFVTDERKFTSMTNFTDAIQSKATEAFEFLQSIENIEIEGVDELKKQLFSSVEFMRRLASAYNAKALENRNIDRIKSDIDDFTLDVSAKIENGILKVKPDLTTRKGRRDFVDVISDKITISRSSNIGYRMQKGAPLKKRKK